MRRFSGAVSGFFTMIASHFRQVELLALALGSALVGLWVSRSNAEWSPFVLPGLACFWVFLFLIVRRDKLSETTRNRLGELNIAMWASLVLVMMLRGPAPVLFALWVIGFVLVWVLVRAVVLLWRSPKKSKLHKLIAKQGCLFEKVEGEDGSTEETALSEWSGKKAELEISADTAVVVDKDGANARALLHKVEPPPSGPTRERETDSLAGAVLWIWDNIFIKIWEGIKEFFHPSEEKLILDKSETVRGVVDLRTQARTEEKIPAMTRDGLPIEVDLYVTFQVERHGSPSLENPYPALEPAIYRVVYNAAVLDDHLSYWDNWKDIPLYYLKMRLRDVVAQYTLNELYEHNPELGDSDDSAERQWLQIPRRRIAADLLDQEIITYLRRNLGIELIPGGSGIGNIAFTDPKVREQVWNQWRRQRDQQLDRQLTPLASRLRADAVLTMVKPVQEQFALLRPAAPSDQFAEHDLDKKALKEEEVWERIWNAWLVALEAFDFLDVAVQGIWEGDEDNRYAQALRNIRDLALQALTTEDRLEEVPTSIGQEYNPRFHEVVHFDAKSALPQNQISRVLRRAFSFRPKAGVDFLRRAQVAVSTGQGQAPGAPTGAPRPSRQPPGAPAAWGT